ncbi:NAD(P)-dependent oxidoreductase [Gemmatimonadetes bacterium T265]|nr:NAD(P)-dependent oxidoreductase [Gemmatimonadetes bacterium T265]
MSSTGKKVTNMPQSAARLLVTGATGQLGSLVVERLLQSVPSASVAVLARRPDAATLAETRRLRELGVDVRVGDYDDRSSLDAAFKDIERLLFISSSAVGARVGQHRNVVDAARAAQVGLIAYTSLLHTDSSPLQIADEHRATEAMIVESGLPYVMLRNNWYTENYLAGIAAALGRSVLNGAAGDGRIASATRADYAAAAGEVLLADRHPGGTILELAGDTAFTLTELAAEITRQSGRPVRYENLDPGAYETALKTAGLPDAAAAVVADADAGATRGALFDDGRVLSRVIGRPTTPMAESVRRALAGEKTHDARSTDRSQAGSRRHLRP